MQIGASYQADGQIEGGGFAATGLASSQDSLKNIFAIAANFKRQFNPFLFSASSYYERADDHRARFDPNFIPNFTPNFTSGPARRPKAYGFSAVLAYQGWEFGAAWSQQNETIKDHSRTTGYGLGVAYEIGDWRLGAQWVATSRFVDWREEINAFDLEFVYFLSDGVTIGAGVYYYDIDTGNAPAGRVIGDSYALSWVLGVAF